MLKEVYEIAGGVMVSEVVGMTGQIAGAYLRARGDTPEEIARNSVRGACVGGAIGYTLSIPLGYLVMRKGLKTVGVTQIVWGLAGAIMNVLLYLGVISIPENPAAAQLASFLLPVKVGTTTVTKFGSGSG